MIEPFMITFSHFGSTLNMVAFSKILKKFDKVSLNIYVLLFTHDRLYVQIYRNKSQRGLVRYYFSFLIVSYICMKVLFFFVLCMKVLLGVTLGSHSITYFEREKTKYEKEVGKFPENYWCLVA